MVDIRRMEAEPEKRIFRQAAEEHAVPGQGSLRGASALRTL